MRGMILRLLDQQVTKSAGQNRRQCCNTSDLENRQGHVHAAQASLVFMPTHTVYDVAT